MTKILSCVCKRYCFIANLTSRFKSILEILSSPDYDKQKALAEQRKLLGLKKERLERIIDALDGATKGKVTMTAFDNSDYETARKQYEVEAKQRWGETDAYKEHQEKTADYSKDKWQEVNDGLMEIFSKFAECMQNGYTADSHEAQTLVKELQNYITENYYTCTKDILAGLGQMYVADEHFKANIDKNGDGTADFASKAIEICCN